MLRSPSFFIQSFKETLFFSRVFLVKLAVLHPLRRYRGVRGVLPGGD